MNLENWTKTVLLFKEDILHSVNNLYTEVYAGCDYWTEYEISTILTVDINVVERDGLVYVYVYRLINGKTDLTTRIRIQ